MIRTWDGWVGSANASSVLCRPPKKQHRYILVFASFPSQMQCLRPHGCCASLRENICMMSLEQQTNGCLNRLQKITDTRIRFIECHEKPISIKFLIWEEKTIRPIFFFSASSIKQKLQTTDFQKIKIGGPFSKSHKNVATAFFFWSSPGRTHFGISLSLSKAHTHAHLHFHTRTLPQSHTLNTTSVVELLNCSRS